jgi:hypothetical protein
MNYIKENYVGGARNARRGDEKRAQHFGNKPEPVPRQSILRCSEYTGSMTG